VATYVVTGGAGFVGSHLALALTRHHAEARVVAFDNLHRAGSELGLPRLRAGGVEFVHGDVRLPGELAALGRFDALVECSAEPSVLAGADGETDLLVQTNLLGALHCAQLCARHQATLLFLSTSRVYPIAPLRECRYREEATRFTLLAEQAVAGLSEHGVSEAFPLAGSRSLYGGTKLAAEIMLEEFRAAFGCPVIINRCGVLAGPWQFGKVDQGVTALWVMAHLAGRPLRYLGFGGSGKQVRDLLHVDDLAELVLAQLADPAPYQGRVYNVGGGRERSVSLQELTQLCQAETGRTVPIAAETATRYADIPIFITDCRALQQATGWQPRRTVQDIVADTCRWLRDHPECLATR
jgi:CDP-paratose 2-epimerase